MTSHSQNPEIGQNASMSTQYGDRHITHTSVPSVSAASTSLIQDFSPSFIPSQSTTLSNGVRMKQTAPLGMNIPLPVQRPLVNSNQIPSTLSELHTQTITFHLDSASGNEAEQNQQNQSEYQEQQHSVGLSQSHIRSPWQYHHINSVNGYISSDDNNQNISVSPILDPSTMTARPVNHQSQTWSNPAHGNNRGPQISHSSSNVSLKYFINEDCLVKKLPWRIIKYIAETLQCRSSFASWKDLVELYGWDYERTYLFENKQHDEGIFYSLLRELEFQNYSLEQLRDDLFKLPRRDILNDLNKMITEHNASTNSPSQNDMY